MKKVIIALPGRTYSGIFLVKWSETLLKLDELGYEMRIVNDYSSFVTFSRMKTLGVDVMRGAAQVPFDGKVDYDVWLTIDSDIIFTAEQVVELIEDTDKYPVVAGVYRMADLTHLAAVKDWDVEYFKKHGTFDFIKVDKIDTYEKYTKVAYSGMGFFACRKGVIEKLKYPYFSYPLIEIETEDGKILRDMCSEDVAFCKNLEDAGYDIILNTKLRVGHEKTLVI